MSWLLIRMIKAFAEAENSALRKDQTWHVSPSFPGQVVQPNQDKAVWSPLHTHPIRPLSLGRQSFPSQYTSLTPREKQFKSRDKRESFLLSEIHRPHRRQAFPGPPGTAEKGDWAIREGTFWKVHICTCEDTPTWIRNNVLKRNWCLPCLPHPITQNHSRHFLLPLLSHTLDSVVVCKVLPRTPPVPSRHSHVICCYRACKYFFNSVILNKNGILLWF